MASCLTMDTSFLPVMANTIDHVHMNTFDKRRIIKKKLNVLCMKSSSK